MPQVWGREPAAGILGLCHHFQQFLYYRQPYLKCQFVRQAVSYKSGLKGGEASRCQFTIINAWIAAGYQRYSYEVTSKSLVAQIAAAITWRR